MAHSQLKHTAISAVLTNEAVVLATVVNVDTTQVGRAIKDDLEAKFIT
jgi:hypothetical protein